MNNNWLILAGTNIRYTFEREDDGRWIAIFDGVPGAMAYGESILDAEKRLDALIANIAREQSAELDALRAQLAEAQAERDKARAALAEAVVDAEAEEEIDAAERVILMRRDNQRAAAARRVAAYCRELRAGILTAAESLLFMFPEDPTQPPAPATHTTTNKDKK